MAADKLERLLQQIEVKPLKSLMAWQHHSTKEVKEDFRDLDKLRRKDIKARLKNRETFRKFLMYLLVGQNTAVFLIVALALWFNKIQGLELIFATLIGGTLAETAGLILIIIKWLFSEIPYQEKINLK